MTISLRPYQRAAIDALYTYFSGSAGNPLVVMPTGCHAAGTAILMHDGSTKRVEDVAPGDMLMGPDSKPRRVLQLARGREPMWRIIPKKGEPFVVNEGHILSLATTNEGKAHRCAQDGSRIDNISVRDFLAKAKSWKHLRKLRRVAVDFPDRAAPIIDAWTLGALLGDGCLTHGVAISNPDQEVLDGVWVEMERHGLRYNARENERGTCWGVGFRDDQSSRAVPNRVMAILRSMGIAGADASEKFIPDDYRLGSRETRLAVLAGLLDTDGHLEGGTGFDYISKSQRLADDVVFVARSLGLCATGGPCEKRDQNGGGGTYWRVHISGNTEIIPTRVPRKQARPRMQKKNPLVTGFDFEPLPADDFFGFALDGDHLYLTADFVVHHNTGKSVVIAGFIREAIEAWSDTRILILTHVKELIQQNFLALLRAWPEAPAGIYSAGLSRRDIGAQILFAGIQSIHKHAAKVQRCDLVLIDEAHLLGRTDSGMYRAFLASLNEINAGLLKVVGFTATPYRLDTGMLHEGKDRLFTDIAYDVPVLDMIQQGYLCPVIPKRTTTQLDVAGVGTRGGEFIAGQLEAAVDRAEVTRAAVAEIVQHGEGRGSWLVFCSGVAHARHVRDAIREHGISAETVTGDTPGPERDGILAAYKAGRLRCVTNANVLTTGFDAPGTDLVALLRPTKSIGLYVQMVGRGTRIAEGKEDCIAEGQRVLTDHGLVPIERVTHEMRVWDGSEFVAHEGAVCRGTREVITYAGITATADHRIWTAKGWKALGQCAIEQIAIAVTGDGGTPVRQAEGRFRRGVPQEGAGEAASDGEVPGLPNPVASGLFELDSRSGRMPLVRATEAGAEVVGGKSHLCEAAVHQSERSEIREVWRSRDSLRISIADSDGCLGAGDAWAASGDGTGQDQQRRTVCTRQFAMAPAAPQHDESRQQAAVSADACVPIGAPRSAILGCDDGSYVQRGNDGPANRGALEGPIDKAERRVWDIFNAGPRHRFTVEGVLVHNCLILDFAGNTARHGPIDTVDGRKKEKSDEPGEAPIKVCPECQTINHASVRTCISCGHEFPPPKPQIAAVAASNALLSTQMRPEWCEVTSVSYRKHKKAGKPASMRVEYFTGLVSHAEWICFDHEGYPRQKAEAWWRKRTSAPIPASTEQAMEMVCRDQYGGPAYHRPANPHDGLPEGRLLREPVAIQVRPVGQYTEISAVRFADPEGGV